MNRTFRIPDLSRCAPLLITGGCVLTGILAPGETNGATVNVSSVPALPAASNRAAPGNVLVLADGLRNMRQRAEELKAQFKLESKPGAGTRLTFRYPWPAGR